jgi:gamma-glutamyltranspeptidase / glutathione hydrolase
MVEEVARQVKRFRGPSGPLGGVTIAPGCPMKNNFVFAIIGAIVIASTLSVWDGLKAGPYGEPGQKAVAAEDAGPLVQVCTDKSTPACAAVRGDRSEGWLQQTRSEVMARNGIVTTVQPLAAQAGLRILQEGGNAIDAAVASAAMLNVVYPANTGIGGDLFAMIYVAKEKKVYQLNASGIMPSGATLAHMNELGYKADPKNGGPGSGMPNGGILTVTVPGSVWGWQDALTRFGTKTFKEVLQPAIDYAEQGFPISEEIASGWRMKNALPLSGCCKEVDPDSVKTFYIDGKRPVAGSIFRNPDLAKTLRLIQQQGRDVFYKGEVARAIVKKSDALGGTMTLADLANYRGEWVTPASTTYHDRFTVYGTRAPSQAWGIVEAMNVLDACVSKWYPGQTLASLGPANPLYWHALIEAKKVVYADLYRENADPNVKAVPLDMLTSKAHAASLCSKVNPNHASAVGSPNATDTGNGDTIYLAAADRWGNMVSWINSNFAGWGSGITVPGYGFILHNRGGLFTLDPNSPNVIAPQKRPYNTLSAVLVMQNDRPLLVTGQHGGDQQGQGNMQVLVNVLDLGANVQAAGDMARFSHSQITNKLQLESQLFKLVGSPLTAMGHNAASSNGSPVGGFEGILFTPDPKAPAGCAPGDRACKAPIAGIYRAGSNFREDGLAAGY